MLLRRDKLEVEGDLGFFKFFLFCGDCFLLYQFPFLPVKSHLGIPTEDFSLRSDLPD